MAASRSCMRHRGKKKRVITAATEGQRLLREESATTRTIAKRAGVSAGLAAQWRTGEKLPAEAKRKKLESLFGIPAKSWDRRPTTSSSTTPAPDASAAADASAIEAAMRAGTDLDTLELTNLALASIRATLARGNLSEAASARTQDSLTKLLSLRARLERDQELLDDRIVRDHPQWARIKEAIRNAVEPFPDAARAIHEALEKLGA